MIRLFVALIIPKEIINQIALIRKSISPNEGNLKWEDNSKIHLTLKFIGEVNEELLKPIINELDFLKSFQKINCRAEKFGFFFKAKDEPRILWLGLKIDDIVFTIVNELNMRLSKFSIPIEERKFRAHLTLMRIKNKISKEFIHSFESAMLPEINFAAREIVLMQSKLSSQGSVYKEIKKYNLN